MKKTEIFGHHEMIFRVNEENEPIEIMKFCSNGDILIKGEKVENNIEIYNTFKKWLYDALDNKDISNVVQNNKKNKFE